MTAIDMNGKAPKKWYKKWYTAPNDTTRGWELRQTTPQQVTCPLIYPLMQVNHHCNGDTTPILACEYSPGQARWVDPMLTLTTVPMMMMAVWEWGLMLVHALHCGYHLRDLPNLTVLHGSVNWCLHCCCKVSWSALELYICMVNCIPGFCENSYPSVWVLLLVGVTTTTKNRSIICLALEQALTAWSNIPATHMQITPLQ